MIRNILEMLSVTDYYGQSELIEIAKGKYMMPKTVKQYVEQAKRRVKYLKAQKNGRA